MSKVTPSARRRVSVAAGTVGLAAVGAAMCAGQAVAETGLPALAGGGLPLSANALPSVKGLVAPNPGHVAGLPLAGLPVLGRVPASTLAMAPAAAPTATARAATPAVPAAAAPAASVGATPMSVPLAPLPAPAAALPAPAKAAGPLDGVTGALPMQLPLSGLEQSLPLPGQFTGPAGRSLPMVGGLTGGLPLLGSGAGSGSPLDTLPLSGLAGGLGHLAG